MTTVERIGSLFESWLQSRDAMSVRAVQLMAAHPGGMLDATDLLAAGFTAGYVMAVRDEVETEDAHALAQHEGTCQ